MRILLVEDDREQLMPLQEALSKVGHIVDGVENGSIAQYLLDEKEYDLLVLDWMLPDINGIDLCRYYRQRQKTSPVLMLTARDTTLDKVTGLDAGADDYLVKPVDVVEFLARVRALGRRSPLWMGDSLSLADLKLSLATLTVERQHHKVQLSSREFQLMEYLLRHPQQVLTREQIELALWQWGEEPESNAVATLVKRLRQKLQKVSADHWIESIYGSGYCIQIPDSQVLD
jgi:two-component system, OmpR family, manganese sensing response regulator